MDQGEGSSRRENIRLKGVEVDYTNGRPEKELDLIIAVSGREQLRHKVTRTGTISWEGNFLCPASSMLFISIYEKRMLVLSKRTARFGVPIESIDASTVTLHDAERGVHVKLYFAETDDTGSTGAEIFKEDAAIAKEMAEAKKTLIDKLGKVRALIDKIKPVGEPVSGIHPAIEAAFAAVGILIEACERQEVTWKAALELTKEWDGFLSISDRVHALKDRGESRKAVESMLEVIADAANFIYNHTLTGVFGALVSADYREKIDGFKEKFAKAMKSFELSLEVEISKDIQQEMWLDIVKPALNAHYSADETCLEGTRTSLLRKASEWLRGLYSLPSPGSATLFQIFWLYGMAGSGKSSVANTVAAIVDADKDLDLSCFFCKRDDPNLSNPQRIFPTLAYRIAQYCDDYREALIELLCSPDGAAIAPSDIKTQFKLLLKDLLPEMTAPARPHVIVIDALDECGTSEDQGELAECLLSLVQAVPWIKIFITSRPVPDIHAIFTSFVDSCILSDINQETDTDADIRRFTEANLELVSKKHNKLMLSSDEVDQLVRQAAGLFIWPSTLFKHVRTSRNPPRELRSFLSAGKSKKPLEQLYELYEQVLKSAVNVGHKEDVAVLHAILGTVFITAGNRPLSVEALSNFLRADRRFEDEDGTSVRNMTQALHAVVYEDARMRGAVRVYHPSFLDFLQMKLEDGFQIGLEEIHRLMFRGCMSTMDFELKLNICELQDSFVLNEDVPDLNDRVSEQISEALQYSSIYWFAHLLKSGLKHDEEAISSVSVLFCSQRALFWLEVLSLLEAVGQGVTILRGSALFFNDLAGISEIASDLERFVSSYSEAMESVPHIYLSALSWVPDESWTQEHLTPFFKHLPLIMHKDKRWETAIWMKDAGKTVYSVAHSPDGRYIAAGVGGNIIRIWDARTGSTFGAPLEGHTDDVLTVAFSPDSRVIASGSSDETIRIWNLQSGKAFGEPLLGHLSAVTSIAFSPDGLQLVSGSHDRTVRLWNSDTRAPDREPILGHQSAVLCVCFSPDGRYIVSGSDDKTVQIWDVKTRSLVGSPLLGHASSVTCVAFSQDGQHVASGSYDKTVRIWSESGEALGEPLRGHSSAVASVAFSPDGLHLASGSHDASIRLWDYRTGASVGESFQGHSSAIFSVCFSPDGWRIASGSEDKTLRIWDARLGYSEPKSRDREENLRDAKEKDILRSDDALRGHWNSCCLRMKLEDGWVKDGEKLILWIPYRHRKSFKHGLNMAMDKHDRRAVKAEVDLNKLYEYVGTRWTEIYQP